MEETKHSTEVTSPAEAQFWQEWAAKAPDLLRDGVAHTEFVPSSNPVKIFGLSLGSAMAIATFTPLIPKEYKWLGAGAAVASLIAGYGAGMQQQKQIGGYKALFQETSDMIRSYANAIENDPNLRDQLAEYFSNTITAEDIQTRGLEGAISEKAAEFGKRTPYLNRDAIVNRAMKSNRVGQAEFAL